MLCHVWRYTWLPWNLSATACGELCSALSCLVTMFAFPKMMSVEYAHTVSQISGITLIHSLTSLHITSYRAVEARCGLPWLHLGLCVTQMYTTLCFRLYKRIPLVAIIQDAKTDAWQRHTWPKKSKQKREVNRRRHN